MQNFAIPLSIWINLGLLVAGAVIVVAKLALRGRSRPRTRTAKLFGDTNPA